MKTIESLLQKITNQAIKGDARFIVQLILDWPKIVGSHLSTITKPEKIIFAPKCFENGRLHIQVKHSAYAFELSMQQESLVLKINGFFGKNLINKILFKHGGAVFKDKTPIETTMITPPHVSHDIIKAASHIRDHDLQQALLSLAMHLR